MAAFELSLERAVTLPGTRHAPWNPGSRNHRDQPGAAAFTVAPQPFRQVICISQVMTGVFIFLVEVEEVHHWLAPIGEMKRSICSLAPTQAGNPALVVSAHYTTGTVPARAALLLAVCTQSCHQFSRSAGLASELA